MPCDRTMGSDADRERARILDAALSEAITHGFRDTTIDAILERADTDAEAFARQFGSLEECMLAAWDLLAVECIGEIRGACREEQDWASGVRAALSAVIAWLDEQPSRSRFLVVDPLAVGGALEERRLASLGEMARLLDAGRSQLDDPSRLPTRIGDWLMGGIYDIVYRHFALRREGALTDHLPDLVYFATVPYLGPEGARQQAAAAAS